MPNFRRRHLLAHGLFGGFVVLDDLGRLLARGFLIGVGLHRVAASPVKAATANGRLGSHADFIVQELGGEVCSVWPDQGVEFGVHTEQFELFQIPEWLKHRSCELGSQIDFALGSIQKFQPDDVA